MSHPAILALFLLPALAGPHEEPRGIGSRSAHFVNTGFVGVIASGGSASIGAGSRQVFAAPGARPLPPAKMEQLRSHAALNASSNDNRGAGAPAPSRPGRFAVPRAVLLAGLALGAGALGVAWRAGRRTGRETEALALAAHEIKSPLSAIENTLDVMSLEGARKDPLKIRRWLEDVRDMKGTASQLRQRIDNLLEAARLESGEGPLELAEVDLEGLVRQALDSWRPRAGRCGVSLAFKATSPLPRARADGGLMRQVLDNLLSNAVKFTPRGGQVEVSLAEASVGAERRLRLCVSDTGAGIAKGWQGRLFGKFVRVPGSGKAGTGLGLYICKMLVEAHGGKIWVESAAGQGSAFHVELPGGPA